jgi:hypothetical protein
VHGSNHEGIVFYGLMSLCFPAFVCEAYDCGVGKESVGKYMHYFVMVVGVKVICVYVCATC